jgi:hypothetical protein
MIKNFGKFGSVTPQRFKPKKAALTMDKITVAINKDNHTDFPRNAKTEVRQARTN